MAELADALGSGPSVRKDIGVQVPFRAKTIISKNYRKCFAFLISDYYCKHMKITYEINFIGNFRVLSINKFHIFQFFYQDIVIFIFLAGKIIYITKMSFSNNLKVLLFYSGKKVSDLSRATRISYNTIESYMNKDVLPRLDKAYLIARYFNVTLDYLYTGDDKNEENVNKYPTASELKNIPKQFEASIKRIIHELSLIQK